MDSTFTFLILEALTCSAVFVLVYRLLISDMTHFRWMRIYLICSIVLPLLLPMLTHFTSLIPSGQAGETFGNARQVLGLNASQWFFQLPKQTNQYTTDDASALSISAIAMFLIYGIGLVYRTTLFSCRLYGIRQTIRRGKVEKQNKYFLVKLNDNVPPFSFLNYLFLGNSCQSLSKEELNQVRQHELTHIRQGHSFDLLLLEIIDIIFWFNPAHLYIRRSLQDVHEYLADEVASRSLKERKTYAHLLLRMLSEKPVSALFTAFGGRQIGRRIQMLARKRSGKFQLLRFASVLPLTAALLFLFSCLEKVPENFTEISPATTEQVQEVGSSELKIGSISWEGNQAYTDDELNEVLRLNSGDTFDSAIVEQRINSYSGTTSVSDLYMDNGYLFLSLEIEPLYQADETVDLNFQIYEGEQIYLDDIIIKGNEKIATETILQQTNLRSGDLFSRKQLINAQRSIAKMGYFDAQQVGINPIPKPDENLVDLEFTLIEINN